MRRFHLTRNAQWRPTINVDKLWSLVPEEEKKDLKEDSEIVPVIDTLQQLALVGSNNMSLVDTKAKLVVAAR